MNQLNYASLEASKRLVDAGIVLETEAVWCRTRRGWRLHLKSKAKMYRWLEVIPAPSMAEVWRELPFQTYIKKMDDGTSMVWVCDDDNCESDFITNTNPTDALIDLLIWVKQQGKDGR